MEISQKSKHKIKATGKRHTATAELHPSPEPSGIEGDVSEGHISKLKIFNSGGELVFSHNHGLEVNLVDPEILAEFLENLEDYARNHIK
jgi:hypothetical protein